MAGKVNEWMQIGVRLSNCRQNRNMTQEEMARRLGVTPQAVSKWERGMSLPDVSILLDIARLLGVSTDWLLGAEWLGTSEVAEDGILPMQSEIGDSLRMALEPLELVFGMDVVLLWVRDESYAERVMKIRKELAWEGILMPVVRIRDHSLVEKKEFMICTCTNVLYSEILEDVGDNTMEHIMNMLKETVSQKYHEILYPDLMKDMVDNLRIKYPALIEGVVPERISYGLLTEVSKIVLSHGDGICYLPKFIEVMESCLRQDPELGAEALAQRIRERIERKDNFYVLLHDRKQQGVNRILS